MKKYKKQDKYFKHPYKKFKFIGNDCSFLPSSNPAKKSIDNLSSEKLFKLYFESYGLTYIRSIGEDEYIWHKGYQRTGWPIHKNQKRSLTRFDKYKYAPNARFVFDIQKLEFDSSERSFFENDNEWLLDIAIQKQMKEFKLNKKWEIKMK